jgi:hypothetical protein
MAAQKGIGYQTYVKMLLDEALRREAGKQWPAGASRLIARGDKARVTRD